MPVCADEPRRVSGRQRSIPMSTTAATWRGVRARTGPLLPGFPTDDPGRRRARRPAGTGHRPPGWATARTRSCNAASAPDGVEVIEEAVAYVRATQQAGIRRAVVSSSQNTHEILAVTSLRECCITKRSPWVSCALRADVGFMWCSPSTVQSARRWLVVGPAGKVARSHRRVQKPPYTSTWVPPAVATAW